MKHFEANCPVCGDSHWQVFFSMEDMPIFCNVLWTDQQAAQGCSRGDIRLAFCPNCSFIGNVAFDPSCLEYSQDYENALDFSPRFQDYMQSLAVRLVEQYDLHDKTIIELGCGKGEFLRLLCQSGNNRGIGFDPSYVPLPEHTELKDQVTFIQDFYSDRYANYQGDLICCRHTLEHIQQPLSLLKTLRQTIGDRPNTVVFFEVPNGLDTFRHLAIWDIIYEHCCFFTPTSLRYAFSACGFQVHSLREDYQGQFLCLEATPGAVVSEQTVQPAEDGKHLAADIAAFTPIFSNKISAWKDQLAQIASQGQRAVVWGGGSKGIMFLNLLNLNLLQPTHLVEYVVDINPRKHGMYAAGTGQQIVSPEFLRQYQPDVVFVMNAIYEDEIRQMLRTLDLNPDLICV